MEASVPESHKCLHLVRAVVYEFIGSAITVTTFNFTGNSIVGRALAYFVWWLIAFSVSGAQFNPAVSLAVYIAEGKYTKQIGRLLIYWFF
jgi:hypothetical protein